MRSKNHKFRSLLSWTLSVSIFFSGLTGHAAVDVNFEDEDSSESESQSNESGPPVICDGCLGKDTKVGDRVIIDGRTYEVTGPYRSEGFFIEPVPEYSGKPEDSGHGSGQGTGQGSGQDSGGDSTKNIEPGSPEAKDTSYRFTGRSFKNLDDDENIKDDARRNLENKIINRINFETSEDVKASSDGLGSANKELDLNVKASVNQRFSNAPVSKNKSNDPIDDMDKTLRATGNDLYYQASQAGWVGFDSAPYESERSSELDELRDRFEMLPSDSPQQHEAKEIGITSLRQADSAFKGDKNSPEGNLFLGVAKEMLDLATDFWGVTSLPKDLYRLIAGRDPTGATLSPLERGLAAVGVGLTLTTFGAANGAVKVLEKLGKALSHSKTLEKLTVAELKVIEKIAPHLKGLPNEMLDKVRIRFGSGEKFAIIGRKMGTEGENGVLGVYEKLKGHVEVEIFNGSVVPEVARDNWKRVTEAAKMNKQSGRLTQKEVTSTPMYIENKKWVDKILKEDRTIIDLGNPYKESGVSWFYRMEKFVIFGAKK